MPFVAEEGAYRIVDAERGWVMTKDGGITEYDFLLTHTDGSTIKFTAREVGHRKRPEGTAFEWHIFVVAHKPTPARRRLSTDELHELIRDAVSAYGAQWGGISPAQLEFL